MTQETQKKIVSKSQYEKELEKTAMWLERDQYLSKEKAWAEAEKEVSEKYEVG